MTSEPVVPNMKGILTIPMEAVTLADFATKRTPKLLARLKIQGSFLTYLPEKWSTDERYQQGRQRVKELHVVNDNAERAVKLFEEFNKLLLTNNEEEKQFIL